MSAVGRDPAFREEVRARTSLVALIGADVALKRRGREHWACCPFHSEKTASFSVSEEKGFAHCFGCGWHGDAFDYVMERTGCDFPAALEDLAIRAGLRPDRDGRVRPKVKPIARPSAEDLARRSDEVMRRASEIWRASQPVGGTLVETYLKSRGIDPAAIPGWPLPTLRFHPGLDHWVETRDGKKAWRFLGAFPAMIAFVTNPDKSFAGVHRTWLRADGGGKADVPSAKKMLGDTYGGALRLCPAASELAVAEGIETALSIIAATGLPVWAALSEGNLGAALPPICRRVILCADNDTKDKKTTAKRLENARAAHAARGCTVSLCRPPEGMDFNDLLLRGAVA